MEELIYKFNYLYSKYVYYFIPILYIYFIYKKEYNLKYALLKYFNFQLITNIIK